MNSIHDFVTHSVMCRMAPPREHVGRLEHFVAQPVLRLLKRRRADSYGLAAKLLHSLGQHGMNPTGINAANGIATHLVEVFIPDSDS